MTMDTQKKTALEKKIVIGLAMGFAVTLTLSLRSAGMLSFGGTKVPAVSSVAPMESVNASRSIGSMVRERWNEANAVGGSNAATVSTERSTPIYTAEDLRDPFKQLLPAPAPAASSQQTGAGAGSSQHTASGLGSSEAIVSPPSLTIQGILWGGKMPQAIINGKVYNVYDRVSGAKIIAIRRDGVLIEHQGASVLYSLADTQRQNQSGSGFSPLGR
ncbi:MAG: hypothetical protein HYT88_05855 [Candidatus Omnitrophica bacterium]|nr:hypothetical protein [Candidatus Omnitrophota bacterium]